MKKRVAALGLVVCLAVSMMLTMTSCGKKSLEEYMNSKAMQTLIETYSASYAEQGMSLEMSATGDELHMDVTVDVPPSDEVTALLEDGMEDQSSAFVDMANQMKDACSNDTVTVVVTYKNNDGTVLATGSFDSTN